MRYKSKHDILLKDFLELNNSELFQSDDLNDKDQEINRIFRPDSMEEFAKALEVIVKPKWYWRKRKFNIKKAGKFIDFDTLLSEGDTMAFLKMVTRTKNISLAKSEHYVQLFMQQSIEIKANHEYIYNPPALPMTGEETQGSIERADFVSHYGGYMEITYLIAKGDFSKFDDILKWDLDRYLFFGEYLLRKRRVENIK